jgi:cytidyltransferase-like protein
VRNPVLYTGGTFDLLHPGHVFLFQQCRQYIGPYGKIVVALNTDEFVMEYKRIIPTHNYASRRSMLEGLEMVDLVVKNVGGSDSKMSIEVVNPTIIAIGEDWKERDYYAQMGFTSDWLAERGIQLWYVPHLKGFSSTNVRKSLAYVP